jgi:multiple sugar transport system permease protein
VSQQEKLAHLMIAPALLLLIFIVGYPFMTGIYLSLTDARVGQAGTFVGIKNFLELSQSPLFQTALKNSVLYTFICVAVKLFLGLALALILNRALLAKKFIRGVILLPWVIPIVLSATGWKWMYDSTFSVINWTLAKLGFIDGGILWLGSPWLARFSVILVNIWRGTPFFAINLLAGLMTIPKEVYEAAKSDGAGTIASFWYITLPFLWPVLTFVILFSTVMTISDFTIVYVLTQGGPLNSTHLLPTLAYQIGLITGNLAKGAAISLFIFPVLLAVVYFQLRLMRRKWAW